METLAAIFIGAVTALNTLVPQANLPEVLGVETERQQVVAQTDIVTSSTLPEASMKRNESLEQARLKRKQIEQQLLTRKQEVKDRIASREAEAKLNRIEIKDQRKRQTVDNIGKRLVDLNDKWVMHWNSALTRLSEILAKIQARGDSLASSGKDITSLNNKIAAAKISIANAQGAVNAQSERSYIFDISSENNLGRDIKALISQFHADIKTTFALVKTARKSVVETLVQLGKLTGEEVSVEEDTVSPTPSATVLPTATPEPSTTPTISPSETP